MMKKAVVIGGCGHIGSYLVPRLVEAGYDVTSISRGIKAPYTAENPTWKQVHYIHCDRNQLAKEKKFGQMIADLKPDVIVDTTCFDTETLDELCTPILKNSASASKVKLIEIGSIWVYGYKITAPVTEDHVHNAICDYGKGKTAMETMCRELSQSGKINTTVLHPGHISGEGWWPINPQANFNPQVYADIIAGKELLLPNDGNATIHHVHADDIAGLTLACLEHPDVSCGEAFNATSERALSLRGFAELMFNHFGHEPKISYLPFEEFSKNVDEADAKQTLEHILRCPSCSMEKAKNLLGFVPKYSSIDTVIRAVAFQQQKGQ